MGTYNVTVKGKDVIVRLWKISDKRRDFYTGTRYAVTLSQANNKGYQEIFFQNLNSAQSYFDSFLISGTAAVKYWAGNF